MPTPTETLEALVTAFELLYSAPTFSAVDDGTNTGDKFIETTVTIDTVDHTLRVDYRVSGADPWMNNWTVTCTDPVTSGYALNEQLDETADETDLLEIITDYLAALAVKDTNLGDFLAEFVAV